MLARAWEDKTTGSQLQRSTLWRGLPMPVHSMARFALLTKPLHQHAALLGAERLKMLIRFDDALPIGLWHRLERAFAL